MKYIEVRERGFGALAVADSSGKPREFPGKRAAMNFIRARLWYSREHCVIVNEVTTKHRLRMN